MRQVQDGNFVSLEPLKLYPCPVCNTLTDSLKCFRFHRWTLCLVVRTWAWEATCCACPQCVRKILRRRKAMNVLTANLAWPMLVRSYLPHFSESRQRGHSDRLVEIVPKLPRGSPVRISLLPWIRARFSNAAACPPVSPITEYPNERVRVTRPESGYPHDVDQVRNYLDQTMTYTIIKRVIGKSSAQVWLKEVPDVSFNSVHFSEVFPIADPDNRLISGATPVPGSVCPYCGETLRTAQAKQCFQCKMDWHDPQNIVCRRT